MNDSNPNHTLQGQSPCGSNSETVITTPTELPASSVLNTAWQQLNKDWWELHPMRYDWKQPLLSTPGTVEFYEEIDKRFFDSVRTYLPWNKRPFDTVIDFNALQDRDVLEIGVGHGTHASLITPCCRSYTGIDLTATSVTMTKQRFAESNFKPTILQMDAERMGFADQSFDYIWSWGVLHHSANTLAIIKEMHRVLRSDGTATVMVYYRSWWKVLVDTFLIRGIILGQLFRGHNLNDILQSATDGAIARFYTPAEWRLLCQDTFALEDYFITGMKVELLPIPHGQLKDRLLYSIPDRWSRFLTSQARCGTFLIVRMQKIETKSQFKSLS